MHRCSTRPRYLEVGLGRRASRTVGDKVTLGALRDVTVAFSARPQDQDPVNGRVLTDIGMVDRGAR